MFNHRRVAPNQPEANFGEEKGSQGEREHAFKEASYRGDRRERGVADRKRDATSFEGREQRGGGWEKFIRRPQAPRAGKRGRGRSKAYDGWILPCRIWTGGWRGRALIGRRRRVAK